METPNLEDSHGGLGGHGEARLVRYASPRRDLEGVRSLGAMESDGGSLFALI